MTAAVGVSSLHHIYMTGVPSGAIVAPGQPAPSIQQSAGRLASLDTWRGLKDTMFSLIGGRKATATLADVGQKLAVLDVPPDAVSLAEALLFDQGNDVGRHFLAKVLDDDDLEQAMNRLAKELDEAGFGRLRIDGVFHRTANARFAPAGTTDPDAPLIPAFVAGMLHGALSELFNSSVRIDRTGGTAMTIHLGPGRDVNEQEKQDG